jgi:hypothetical protein
MNHTFKIFSQVFSIWIIVICFLMISPNLAIADHSEAGMRVLITIQPSV